jgi:tRNA1Val (adenine37-N6)-methyltransferase
MQGEFTDDSIWRKDIQIRQPGKGYRFALDAVLLAHFIKTNPADRLLEIGAGSGVVTILVSALQKFHSVIAIELQKELADMCRFNFAINKVPNGVVLEANVKDAKTFLDPNSMDVVYSNPPYRKAGSGKLNPQTQKAIARHEVQMNLKDLFECVMIVLKPSGRLITILPIFREKDFSKLMNQYEMHLNERMYVHSFSDESPKFFLTAVSKLETSLIDHHPLTIYKKPGDYTEEMRRLLGV